MNRTAFDSAASAPLLLKLRAFLDQCKLRVNSLIVFTAMIGMLLAVPGWPSLSRFIFASLGIALVAGAAAAINCLVERTIDARMARTRARPLPQGIISPMETLTLACITGGLGLWLLGGTVNTLTMWLTLATFLGYAIIYTVVLKPATPMNIVIGGASGAMPPILGWAAMTGEVSASALALFLIIFLWTPPHFWALACYRRDEYAAAGLPMLPVTHGVPLTCFHILLYTVMLAAVSYLPYTLGTTGPVYLALVSLLNLYYLVVSWKLWRNYSDDAARASFRWSIFYLTALFAALFADRLF
ncbi:MAG: protoheme IX farnesyltransferase [Rhodocyclaceae bacterium]|nr:MAG: protoheme IX farnesyltransferase [Rhodocyclaceae bacterium]